MLPCFGKLDKRNVGPVLFDRDLSITQKAGANKCIFKLGRLDYILEGRFVMGSADQNKEQMFVGVFQVTRPGTCHTDDLGSDQSVGQASECPLAKISSTFTAIRLVVSSVNTNWKQDGAKTIAKPDVLRGQLNQLCTGHLTANPESKWSRILRTDMDCLRAESEAQEKLLGTLRCRIVTHAGKGNRSLIIETFPVPPKGQPDEAKEYDWENQKLGGSYRLKAPVNFPTDDATMGKHRVFGKAKTTGWSITIVKNMAGFEAPLVGAIENSFDDISSFVGLAEENVTLEPVFNDVLGDCARSTIHTVKGAVDDFEAELNQFFSNPRYPPQIPAITLFSLEKCNEEANKLPFETVLPPFLQHAVNPSQLQAIETILNCRISVTWGAPGTGKSKVLSEAILWLLDNTEECMVGTAVANVAVDALLQKVCTAFSFSPELYFEKHILTPVIITGGRSIPGASSQRRCPRRPSLLPGTDLCAVCSRRSRTDRRGMASRDPARQKSSNQDRV